ncbi:MAG: MFS transporter [Rhodococcus sp.]|uniref:MFS transporter n=1 Tax=Rhodococcus sp. TaxID=1831 RepID=UPI0016A59C8C|nr:MFS transporter [Rhodococcus sp. (in: high G+C Gram-positive bacteria)]NLV80196.1 MFS transporter [Rhodococcus sp. (in: high G+C Gram-positive bacteria)]
MTARAVAYSSTREFVPLYGLYALLFADHGLSTGAISSLFVIWSVVAFVSEVPSGAWADTVSRRGLLFGSGALVAVAFALWILWPTYWGFAAGFALWGVGESLKSGTFEALVYDELAALGAEHRYTATMGYANAGEMVCVFVATTTAAPLYDIGGYALVGWVSVALIVANTALVATLPSAPRTADADEFAGERSFVSRYVATVRAGTGEVRTDRVVRRAVLLAAALLAFLALDEYFGLLAREGGAATEYVPLLVALTVVGQVVGAATAGLTASMGGAAAGGVVVTGAVALAAGSVLGGVTAVGVTGVLGFVAIGVGYGALHNAAIVAEARVQETMSGRARATVASLVGLVSEVVSVTVYAGFAFGSVWFPLWASMVATAVLLLGVGIVAVRWLPATAGSTRSPSVDSQSH